MYSPQGFRHGSRLRVAAQQYRPSTGRSRAAAGPLRSSNSNNRQDTIAISAYHPSTFKAKSSKHSGSTKPVPTKRHTITVTKHGPPSSKSTTFVKAIKANTGVPTIHETHDNDILGGRGGKVNSHPGNARFRQLVHELKSQYQRCTARDKNEKQKIAEQVIRTVTRGSKPPGRFLIEIDANSNVWYEMTERAVFAKVTQALRERKESDDIDWDSNKNKLPAKQRAPIVLAPQGIPVRKARSPMHPLLGPDTSPVAVAIPRKQQRAPVVPEAVPMRNARSPMHPLLEPDVSPVVPRNTAPAPSVAVKYVAPPPQSRAPANARTHRPIMSAPVAAVPKAMATAPKLFSPTREADACDALLSLFTTGMVRRSATKQQRSAMTHNKYW